MVTQYGSIPPDPSPSPSFADSSCQRISVFRKWPIHTFGHLWTKVLWFVFGLLLTGLSATGVLIYSRRLANGDGEIMRIRRGVGLWAYPAIALIVLALTLSPWVLAG